MHPRWCRISSINSMLVSGGVPLRSCAVWGLQAIARTSEHVGFAMSFLQWRRTPRGPGRARPSRGSMDGCFWWPFWKVGNRGSLPWPPRRQGLIQVVDKWYMLPIGDYMHIICHWSHLSKGKQKQPLIGGFHTGMIRYLSCIFTWTDPWEWYV